MSKIVVDTNCLIDNPELLLDSEYQYAISYVTLQELDKHKSNPDLSYPARSAIKIIYQLFREGKIDILNVPTEGVTNDEKIVNDCKDIDGILMSQDIGALVVAQSRQVETYDLAKVDKEWDKTFKGYLEIIIDDKAYYRLTQNEYMVDEIEVLFEDLNISVPLNSYLVLYPESSPYTNYLVWRKFEDKYILVPQSTKHLRSAGIGLDWLHPEQLIAFDCVFNTESKLAVITGKVGSSKTLMSMCGALARTVGHKNKKSYDKILVTRPNIPINKAYALGFMKGPQPLWASVLTETGWKNMGSLCIGDNVISRSGLPTKVVGVFPQGIKQVYKITTDTNKITYACGDHLWLTQDYNEHKHNKVGTVKTTLDIKNSLTYKDTGKLNHYLPINQAVRFKNSELPLSPYVLGCLLGDGCLQATGIISISNIDREILDKIDKELASLDCGIVGNSSIVYTLGAIDGRANKPSIKNGRDFKVYTNPLKNILESLGLLDKKFDTKFIPDIYMYNSSFEDRLELLRGLLDTDGYVYKNRNAKFSSSNYKLAKQVLELVRSMGGYGSITTRDRRDRKVDYLKENRIIQPTCLAYEVSINLGSDINPFYLPRKANLYGKSYISNRKPTIIKDRILSIEEFSMEEVRCIKVEDEEHLYITDDYIVTHNTMEEKMSGWLAPIKTNLQFLYENTLKDRENEEATKIYDEFFQAMPIESIQGASYHNKILLVDEGQLLDSNTLKQIMSRVAEGSKLVLILDPNQTYGANRGQEGYKKLLPHCKGNKHISFVELQHIQRSELVKVVDEIFK